MVKRIVWILIWGVFIVGALRLFTSWQSDQMTTDTLPIATFAAWCFRCIEPAYEILDGTSNVIVWYAWGTESDPTYKDVAYGRTSHRESIQMNYDPDIVSYEDLVRELFLHIDPTDDGGQFVDRGFHYTTAIFTHDDEQYEIATRVIDELNASDKYDAPIVTKVIPYTNFYIAEDYHQDYYKKAPLRYQLYKDNSWRNEYFE